MYTHTHTHEDFVCTYLMYIFVPNSLIFFYLLVSISNIIMFQLEHLLQL